MMTYESLIVNDWTPLQLKIYYVITFNTFSALEHKLFNNNDAGSLDLILNTVSASHEMMTYVPLLAIDGALVQLGRVADLVLDQV